MYIVSVIKGSIETGDTREDIYEADNEADAKSCVEFWEAHPDTLYVEYFHETDERPSMELALLGS